MEYSVNLLLGECRKISSRSVIKSEQSEAIDSTPLQVKALIGTLLLVLLCRFVMSFVMYNIARL